MNYAFYLTAALSLLQETLTALKKSSPLEQDAIAALEAAIAKLQEVQGTDVTWNQLNSLRTVAQWGDPAPEPTMVHFASDIKEADGTPK